MFLEHVGVLDGFAQFIRAAEYDDFLRGDGSELWSNEFKTREKGSEDLPVA